MCQIAPVAVAGNSTAVKKVTLDRSTEVNGCSGAGKGSSIGEIPAKSGAVVDKNELPRWRTIIVLDKAVVFKSAGKRGVLDVESEGRVSGTILTLLQVAVVYDLFK
ncbi:hypothetical protein ACG2E4_12990 [Halalkalibaculum sp. DA384]